MQYRNKILSIALWGQAFIFAIFLAQLYFKTSHLKPSQTNHLKPSQTIQYDDDKTEAELTSEEVSNGSYFPQDDPRLLKYIRKHHLTPPPKEGFLSRSSYKNPHLKNKQKEQLQVYRYVHQLLNNMTGGFFIDCGANDGVFYSNTIPFELDYGFSGLLIEADPEAVIALRRVKRKAWVSDVCLSTQPVPIKMTFMVNRKYHSSISHLDIPEYKQSIAKTDNFKEVKVQCMPLYSLLKAINVTQVDYFSLDIEDAELSVLKTIPWDLVYIKVLSIETHPRFQKPVKEFMTNIGYQYLTLIHNSYSIDQIYMHPNATQ